MEKIETMYNTSSLVTKPTLKVDGSFSDKTVNKDTTITLELTGATPEWGVHFVSITDGYKIIGSMVIADAYGKATMDYKITKTIEIYGYCDDEGGNSNSIKVSVPSNIIIIAAATGIGLGLLYYLTQKKSK